MRIIYEVWLGNNIGDEGAKMIVEGLKRNNSLIALVLSSERYERTSNKVEQFETMEMEKKTTLEMKVQKW